MGLGSEPDAAELAEILAQIKSELEEAAERVVPRFLETMPPEYFRGTDYATRLSHVKAIIATEASGLSQELWLRDQDGSHFTVINEGSYHGLLAELVGRLPGDKPLRSARVHTARDGQLVLDVFDFGDLDPFDPSDEDQAAKAAQVLEYAREYRPDIEIDELEGHFSYCAADYVLHVPAARICGHFSLYRQIRDSDDTVAIFQPLPGTRLYTVIVGISHADLRETLERISRLLARHGIDIQTAHMDTFRPRGGNAPDDATSFLSFIVKGSEETSLDDPALWDAVREELLRVKWVDDSTLAMLDALPGGDLKTAEVLQALCHLVHQVLVKENPFAFARDHIEETAARHTDIAGEIAALFLERFDPDHPMEAAEFGSAVRTLTDRIGEVVDRDEDQTVLVTLTTAVVATLRTNVHVPSRYALCMAIDPSFLSTAERAEEPYGVFYVCGREFDGFHVRFRAIARGGVRVVTPRGQEEFVLEGERLYDEVYGLAFAQQLKNKDIPEGGSKGVLLVTPQADVDLCVKAFASGLLDLVTPDEALRARIVDRQNREDLLYLGPDENITNELIDWIVDCAARRGYPQPNAFMSSKTGAGINHKAYGVTSEGVTVFLDAALRHLGIDPTREPFTVKLTGGPDGDVAGNEIRILQREYGDNARIVAIADGSGSAEDPDGLNHRELLRLVARERPIAEFDPDALGPKGRVTGLDQPEGFKLRNTLHNRVVTDAFIPAGGRPRTLRDTNWQDFLGPDGSPSSRIIIEGANLFLTPDARQGLSQAGVLIVKDSSANKCGVICSSFEVLASMLLSEEEFLAHKEQFVTEVIERLRDLARLEADLLLRERLHKPNVSLPELSERLSRTLIAATDAMVGRIAKLGAHSDLSSSIMQRYVPPVLHAVAGSRIAERIPDEYVTSTIATVLAGTIVYREGLSYLEDMSSDDLSELAMRYLQQEVETAKLAAQVERSDLPDREQIAALLRAGGTGAALRGRKPPVRE